jgi:hypothetical protein
LSGQNFNPANALKSAGLRIFIDPKQFISFRIKFLLLVRNILDSIGSWSEKANLAKARDAKSSVYRANRPMTAGLPDTPPVGFFARSKY